MITFNNILCESLDKTSLRRIIIKVDPTCQENISFAYANGYEGYILKEEDGIARVFVVGQQETGLDDSNIIDIPSNYIDTISRNNELFDGVKMAFLEYINSMGLLEGNEKIIDVVDNSTDPTELRLIAQQLDISDSEILRCYEDFIRD
jgi:hypothetical protein